METTRQRIVRELRRIADTLEDHPQGDDPRIYKRALSLIKGIK